MSGLRERLDAANAASPRMTTLWNGPTCQTCGARHLGNHVCSHEAIVRRINELLALLNRPQPVDRTADCPCRPENGGSGICGCINGGMVTFTC